MKDIAEKLNSMQLKATPQRIAIYRFLLGCREHPNAEAIYGALKEEYPAMSLATVYKTVASLRDVGLIQEINVGEDSFRYDARTDDHAHVICRKCGRVFDFDQRVALDGAILGIKEKLDVEVDACKLFFYGKCGKCGTENKKI